MEDTRITEYGSLTVSPRIGGDGITRYHYRRVDRDGWDNGVSRFGKPSPAMSPFLIRLNMLSGISYNPVSTVDVIESFRFM